MQTTKLLIFLAVWKRPHITEICFKGIERLKSHPDYDIEAVAVISEESMIMLCEKYGINWTMYENSPLGKKKNYGLEFCKQFDFEYLMEIGSDDLVTNDLLTHYLPYLKYGFIGVRDLAYIDSDTGSCKRLQSNSTYGAGRVISREFLERVNWKLWRDSIDRGMDNNSVFHLAKHGIGYKQVPSMEEPGVIDIKSDINLWPFNHLLGVDYDLDLVFKNISEDEINLIEACYKQESKLEA